MSWNAIQSYSIMTVEHCRNTNGSHSSYIDLCRTAGISLFSLQMWAKCVNASVNVVEPFVLHSMLRLPIVFSEKQLVTQLRFRYYFHI